MVLYKFLWSLPHHRRNTQHTQIILSPNRCQPLTSPIRTLHTYKHYFLSGKCTTVQFVHQTPHPAYTPFSITQPLLSRPRLDQPSKHRRAYYPIHYSSIGNYSVQSPVDPHHRRFQPSSLLRTEKLHTAHTSYIHTYTGKQNPHSTNSSPPARHGAPRPAMDVRKTLSRISALLLLIAFIFLLLVEIGSLDTGPVLSNIYFLRLDLSQIIPESVPNSQLLNTVAQTLGLHDFYQVGLWNFCQGYVNEGITSCSDPETLYWFNPVEILLSQLLEGASSKLPETFLSYLFLL